MPPEKTQSFCPGSRDLNRSGKGLNFNFYEIRTRHGVGIWLRDQFAVRADSCTTSFLYCTGEDLMLMDERTYRASYTRQIHWPQFLHRCYILCVVQKLNCFVSFVLYVSPAGVGAPV
jgi:hypothetical protein